jgi:pyridine nucleotide-disulfide oxidoreductase
VTGKGTFRDEFVTCGGIALSHLHLNTLESKVCRHLFFAGEVLDIDAITGGFNLQAAWTTGYVAGRSLVADTSTPPHSSLTPQ